MLTNLQHDHHDDEPTKPDGGTTTRTLVLAARAERQLELALERLTVGVDADSIVAATENVRQAFAFVRAVRS